jgi:peptidoglycan/xylan/chitin deacetylase (PgdA/CDA1 family)
VARTPALIPDRFVALLYHDVHPGEVFDYGRLGRSATMYHISERAFRSQLDVIERCGIRCLSAAAMRACLAGAGTRDGPGLVLCFDDGWSGAVECAAPALAERGMAAFFFITTGFIGRRFFAGQDGLRRLDPSLFTIGSHGVTHRMLSDLPSDGIVAELSDSRRSLEDLLGRPVNCLSLPGGAADSRVFDIAAAAGYDHIFTSALGMNPAAAGRRGIARIGVRRTTDLPTLRRWLAGDLRRERARAALLAAPKRLLGMRTYSKLRRVLLGEAVGREHFFEP